MTATVLRLSPWLGCLLSSLHPHILGWPRCTVGFPGCSVVKNPPAKAGDSSSIVGSGRSPGGENGNPLQYPRLENPMDRELGRLQSVGSQKGRHDLVTKHQRKGIFYLEWCHIKDMVFIHSFIRELLGSYMHQGLRPQKWVRHNSALKQFTLQRDAHRSRHIIFSL